MQNKKYFFLLGIVLVYHLVSLTRSPLPWLDEVIFKSITHSYAETGNLYCEVAPFAEGKQVVQYGPVYFFIASHVEKLLGTSMFYYRMISLVSGFIFVFLIYFFIRDLLGKEHPLSFLFLCILLFDPIVSQSMHGGRMDLMAGSIFLSSLYFFLKMKESLSNNTNYKYAILSGTIAALAVLTTPRVGVLLIAVCIVFLIRLIQEKRTQRFVEGFLWAIAFSLPVALWVFFAFDGNELQLTSYNPFGGNFFFKNEMDNYLPFVYPLVGMYVWALFFLFFSNWKNTNELVLISAISIPIFFLLIFETGGYYIIVLPFFYMLLAFLLSQGNTGKFELANKILVYGFVLFNLSLFLIKTANIAFSWNARNPAPICNFVEQNVPAGSKVIGTELFYYSILENGSYYQFIKWNGEDAARELHHRTQFGYEYIIVPKSMINSSLLNRYFANSELIWVADFNSDSTNKLSSFEFAELGESYNCTLYRRVKP